MIAAVLALSLGAARPAMKVDACGAPIEVVFADGALDASAAELTAWITRAACAVGTYYGRFPVDHYTLRIQPVPGDGIDGTTWGGDGVAPHTALRLGRHARAAELARDWVLTHEMVHLAFPDVGDEHHWLEEGLATYVEPLARSWIGAYDPAQVWLDLVQGVPRGMPGPRDKGLDGDSSWGRTYWGGALFCLLADVRIRERTHDKLGLRDALRAIVNAGGTHQASWTLEKTLKAGDAVVGAPVLEELYAEMAHAPMAPDLDALWKRLGVAVRGGKLALDDAAPEAQVRRAISARPADARPCAELVHVAK